MTPSTANPAADGSSPVLWPGRLWLALLVAGIVVLEFRMTPRDALDIGEGVFSFDMLFGFSLGILLTVTIVAWLWAGVARLGRRDRSKAEPWIRIGIVALVLAGLATKRTSYVPANPIQPDSEPIYMRIALVVREELEKPGGDAYLPLDQKIGAVDGDAQRTARARLDEIIPAYWPRAMLYVLLENNCVVLARGSGMLGQVGVRIYDRGPAEIHSVADLRRNPYLPSQCKITDRLWYFTSD